MQPIYMCAMHNYNSFKNDFLNERNLFLNKVDVLETWKNNRCLRNDLECVSIMKNSNNKLGRSETCMERCVRA